MEILELGVRQLSEVIKHREESCYPVSYRQSDNDLVDEWLDELNEDAIEDTQESVDKELELVRQALDSAELGYAVRASENDGENDAMLNHRRNVRGSLVAYLRSQED